MGVAPKIPLKQVVILGQIVFISYPVAPKMLSHGCPMVTVAGWSCPWWWYYWPRHCGNRGKASGRWSAGGLNPSPRNGWWSQNHMRSGFEIPMVEISRIFKNDILGEPIHTMHTYCWVVCFFFKRWNTKPIPSRPQSLCWCMFFPFPGGHCFFTSSSFPRMIYNKNMFFLHLTKFEKKHTSYKNTCEKIWAISHGYATNGGTLGWVGWPVMHHLNHHLPIILAMCAFISPLPCAPSENIFRILVEAELTRRVVAGSYKGPFQAIWRVTGQLVAGGVVFLAKLMENRWK